MSWVAALDIGTVSAQLLVTDGSQRLRRSVDVLLGGSFLTPTGEVRSETIDDEALERLRTALAGFRADIEQHQAPLRAVATAAARRARNADALVDIVSSELDVELDILDGADEARLSYLGVLSDLSALVDAERGSGGAEGDRSSGGDGHTMLTIDIGGGSTEFALGTADGLSAAVSLPVGGALLSGAYLQSDPPRPEELSAALSVVELHIDDVQRELPGLRAGLPAATVVGLGGVVTVAAIEVGLNDLVPEVGDGDGPLHGFILERDAVEDVFRTIATESRADRAFNPGLPPSRVDTIVGGCALLVETMRQLDLDQVVVSQRGLLDGIAAESARSRS